MIFIAVAENIEIFADTNFIFGNCNHAVVGVNHNCVNLSVGKNGVEDKIFISFQ